MPCSNKIVLTHSNNNYFISNYETYYYYICSKTEENLKKSYSKAINKLVLKFGLKKVEDAYNTMHVQLGQSPSSRSPAKAGDVPKILF